MNSNYIIADAPTGVLETLGLKDKSDPLKYKKGQIIYCEGSTPLGIYYVSTGKIKISKIGSDGKEQIINILSGGDILNFSDLLINARNTTSAKALEDSQILFVPRHEISELLGSSGVHDHVLSLLSQNLRFAHEKITDLAYKPVRGRLAEALVFLANKFNECSESSPCVSLTRFDLACYIGTAKETVNRLMSEFRSEGLVKTNGSMIYILDMDGLEKVGNIYH